MLFYLHTTDIADTYIIQLGYNGILVLQSAKNTV